MSNTLNINGTSNTFGQTSMWGAGYAFNGFTSQALSLNATTIGNMYIDVNGKYYGQIFVPCLNGGSYNSMVKYGDSGIIFNSFNQTPESRFVICPYSDKKYGLVIDPSGNHAIYGDLNLTGKLIVDNILTRS